MKITSGKTLSTTFVEVPYPVLLEAALRFDDTTIDVQQHVLLGDRIVVSSASGEGYWHIPNDPELIHGAAVPKAVFQPDPTTSFSYFRSN